MRIPAFLHALYRDNHKLDSFASSVVAAVDGYVKANSLVFFPEYTDHGISHLELTLQTAFDLANDEARSRLTPSDAVALVAGVCLHDFGMYLSRDGFESLVSPDCRWSGVPYFDKKTWTELWEEFYSEATRFDGRKLRALFGESYRPVRPLPKRGSRGRNLIFCLSENSCDGTTRVWLTRLPFMECRQKTGMQFKYVGLKLKSNVF
jgi:molecular chaperone HtpG